MFLTNQTKNTPKSNVYFCSRVTLNSLSQAAKSPKKKKRTMIRLGLGKKISNSQTVILLMFRRNITLGHRFWSRKLSRKVICSRAEFTGKLAQMAFKITGGFTHQQLTAGQRNDVNNFFFGNWRKDTSWWFWIESRKRCKCKMLYFVNTELYILSGLLFRKCKIVV